MLLKSTRVWYGGHFQPAIIEVAPPRIWEIYPYGDGGERCLDFGSCMILPGFIDIHTHGAYEYDTNDARPQGLRMWALKLVEEGVTGFLPTVVTDTVPRTEKAARCVAEVMRRQNPGEGATILGVHLEGPFLNPEYHGAQPVEDILEPTLPQLREFWKASSEQIRIITLAPEMDKNFSVIRLCNELGIVVSIGHSGATYQEVQQACVNGARSITHTFNAQSGLHHRENGVAGAALEMENLYSEIICDGNHVHPEVVRLFFRCKGPHRGMMVSDSLRCKGLEPGAHFLFADQACIIDENGAARIASSGRLAGSTLRLNQGLRFLLEEAHVDPVSAINATALNQAELLGIADHVGRIQAGYDADLTILDSDYSVVQTLVKGQLQKQG